MTHIGYAKPQTFIAFEAVDTITGLELTKSFYPLLGFCRLQGSTHTFIGWITPTPS
jgi:hypothetical protein